MKHPQINWIFILLLISNYFMMGNSLANQCGIQYCSSCDPVTKFCYECDLPYKPGYANQTVCTRCANNCAVCETIGDNSDGRCLSCMSNFDYSLDDHCDTFYIWIYAVVIICYVVFIITLFIVFCYIKRRKEAKRSQWFQGLKTLYNRVETQKHTIQEFQKMCQSLVQLLKQSSSYNNLKFKDRQYEKAMKIKQIKLKSINKQTHIKTIKIRGFDNSQFQGTGFVYIPTDHNNRLKLWFAKNYKRQVFSEKISKIIIYESQFIQPNEIRGRWYYYGCPQISGKWRGSRQIIHPEITNDVKVPK